MKSLLARGLTGLCLALALLIAAVAQGSIALSLHEAATTSQTEMSPTIGTYRGQAGWGPWRTEVVELPGGIDRLRLAPLPEGVDVGVHPDLLVHEGAARFAEVEPAPRAWVPFAVTAALLLAAAVGALAFAITPLGTAVFGQRDPEARAFGWLPGHGTHGGNGGQVPPYVPYSRDWDPKNRSR